MTLIEEYDQDGYFLVVEAPVTNVVIEGKVVQFRHGDNTESRQEFAKKSDLIRFANWLSEFRPDCIAV